MGEPLSPRARRPARRRRGAGDGAARPGRRRRPHRGPARRTGRGRRGRRASSPPGCARRPGRCTRSRPSTTRRSASAGTARSTGRATRSRRRWSPPRPPTAGPSGRVTLGKPHEGPPGLVHGGVVATLLDHVLARAVRAAGRGGLTATLTVTYRRPVHLGVAAARHRGDRHDRRTADDRAAPAWSPRTTRRRRSPRPRDCSWRCGPERAADVFAKTGRDIKAWTSRTD